MVMGSPDCLSPQTSRAHGCQWLFLQAVTWSEGSRILPFLKVGARRVKNCLVPNLGSFF